MWIVTSLVAQLLEDEKAKVPLANVGFFSLWTCKVSWYCTHRSFYQMRLLKEPQVVSQA